MRTRDTVVRPLGDTENMLEQWGWWRMSGMGVPRYVSPSFALMRDNMPQPGAVSHCITDELAMAVDGCVARLIEREKRHGLRGPFMGDFIWLYYGAKWPALRIARTHSMGEAKAREMIQAGVAWVDAALENLREAA